MLRSFSHQANKFVKGFRARTSWQNNAKTMNLATIAAEEACKKSGEGKGAGEKEKVVLRREIVKLEFTCIEETWTRKVERSGFADKTKEKKTEQNRAEEVEKSSLWSRLRQRAFAILNMAVLGQAVSKLFTKISGLFP